MGKAFQNFIQIVRPKLCFDENYNTFYQYDPVVLSYEGIDQEAAGLSTEMVKLEHELYSISKDDRFLYASNIFRDLLDIYTTIREDMGSFDEVTEEKKIRRSLMLTVDHAIMMVVIIIGDRHAIPFPNHFIAYCKNNGSTYSDIMDIFNEQNIINSEMDSGISIDSLEKGAPLTLNKSAIVGKYKFNPKDPDYMTRYLDEVCTALMLNNQNKLFFGAVCFVLHNWSVFINYNTFKELMKILALYWGVEPPKDTSPNKYKNKAKELTSKYYILEKIL